MRHSRNKQMIVEIASEGCYDSDIWRSEGEHSLFRIFYILTLQTQQSFYLTYYGRKPRIILDPSSDSHHLYHVILNHYQSTRFIVGSNSQNYLCKFSLVNSESSHNLLLGDCIRVKVNHLLLYNTRYYGVLCTHSHK